MKSLLNLSAKFYGSQFWVQLQNTTGTIGEKINISLINTDGDVLGEAYTELMSDESIYGFTLDPVSDNVLYIVVRGHNNKLLANQKIIFK